jgi:hypothetical protein
LTGQLPSYNIATHLTKSSEAAKFQNGNKNRDHPKAYFGKWKHHVDVVFNDKFGNDCLGAVLNKKDYHSDDYAYYASDNLIVGSAVPGESRCFISCKKKS